MSSWIKVFKFSFKNTAGGKGYIATTVLVALALLLGISGGMVLVEKLSGNDDIVPITHAYVVGDADLSIVGALGGEYGGVVYENVEDIAEVEDGLALVLEDGLITAVVSDDSEITLGQAENFAAFVASAYPYVLANGSAAELSVPSVPGTEVQEEMVDYSGAGEMVEMIVAYVVAMLMYFMVLIYGQGIANDAIMEKTSKLMDLFLVSVKPGAMMLGKTMAGAAAGLLQALVWIFSAVGGCMLGSYAVKLVDPETDMALVMLLDGVTGMSGLFAPAALITAAGVMIAGFVVYCALAGMGGALASKPEDLGATNYMFTLALVISFFACLFSGESAGMISAAEWMAYVPFTAVLVMPGRLLTGAAEISQGVISIGICLVFAVALNIIAGKMYTLMAFYRGKPVNPVKMLRSMVGRKNM